MMCRLVGIVLGHQHPRRRHRRHRRRPARPLPRRQRGVRRRRRHPEAEGAAEPRHALDRDLAPHQLDQLRGEIARPRPVPPRSRFAAESTWVKRWKRCRFAASGMPTPVSRTATRSRPPSAAIEAEARLDAARLGELDRVADEVDQHLPEPRRRRRRATGGTSSATVALTSRSRPPQPAAISATTSRTQAAHVRRRAVEGDPVRLELREVEDVVQDRRAAAAPSRTAIAARSRWAGSRSVRRIRSSMPITPFIGVRISWLMVARNSDFATDAPSASSRLAISSSLFDARRR